MFIVKFLVMLMDVMLVLDVVDWLFIFKYGVCLFKCWDWMVFSVLLW